MSEEREHRIEVTGIYGVNTELPIVQVGIPEATLRPLMRRGPTGPEPTPGVVALQLRVDEARDLALNLLQSAEAAIGDGFVMDFFMREMGLEVEQAAPLMLKLRGYRTKHEAAGT